MNFNLKLKKWKAYLLQYKGLGIFVSIALLILGILSFIFPRVIGTFALWSVIVSIFITGIFNFICYFFGNANEARHPFNLIKGVANTIVSCGLLIPLIISASKNGFLEALNTNTNVILFSITVFLGIYLAFSGLFKILSANKVKAFGGSKVSEIIMGSISLILGIVLFILLMLENSFGVSYVIGTYLIVFSIILIVELITNPLVQDKNKVYTLKKAKPNSKNEEVEVEIV